MCVCACVCVHACVRVECDECDVMQQDKGTSYLYTNTQMQSHYLSDTTVCVCVPLHR